MEIITAIRDQMICELEPLGFKVVEEEINGAFGSYYVTIAHRINALRFVWDNRESWFLLEQTNKFFEPAFGNWNELLLIRIPRKQWGNEKVEEVIYSFISEIKKYKGLLQG